MKTIQLLILSMLIILVYSCEEPNTKKTTDKESDVKSASKFQDVSTDSFQKTGLNNQENTSETLNETWDLNTTIGEGIIWRKEETEGSNNWSEIVVTNIFGFKKNVDTGEIVQIIPLRKELPIIELAVVNTTKRDDLAPDIWYEVVLQSIPEKHQEYRTVKSLPDIRQEYPSDVLLVYPAVKNCTLLFDMQFDAKNLPEKISNDIIKAALDLDGDKLPDVIVCSFCCKTRKTTGNCDYICGETYLKVNNKWTMINSSQPM